MFSRLIECLPPALFVTTEEDYPLDRESWTESEREAKQFAVEVVPWEFKCEFPCELFTLIDMERPAPPPGDFPHDDMLFCYCKTGCKLGIRPI